jgi:hypothetical protein
LARSGSRPEDLATPDPRRATSSLLPDYLRELARRRGVEKDLGHVRDDLAQPMVDLGRGTLYSIPVEVVAQTGLPPRRDWLSVGREVGLDE